MAQASHAVETDRHVYLQNFCVGVALLMRGKATVLVD